MNKIMGILLLLVSICAATALLSDKFALPYNMQNIVRYSAYYGILGIGVSLVIMTGGIDLSIGSMIGLTGCILPMLLVDHHWSPVAAVLAVLALSGLLGLGHGLLITKLRLQPFIVTLCGLLIYRGVARWLTHDGIKGFGSDLDYSLRLLAIGKPCSMATLILIGGLALLAWTGWQCISARNSTAVSCSRSRLCVTCVVAVALIAIGSSRFWRGVQFSTTQGHSGWSAQIPEGSAQQPQVLMQQCGWLALAALGWLLATTLPRNARRMAPPVVLTAVGAALVYGAKEFMGEELTALKVNAVISSLAILIAGIGWLAQAARAAGGEAAASPLTLSGFFAGLWLLGQIPLGEMLVPAPLLVLIAMTILASVFLNQTIYGRYLLALGSNEEAARYSGINTHRMVILAYVLCALCTGVGSVLLALDVNSVQPAGHGNFLELYAIAAAVLGGCSLRGGEGTILGVVIGAAVMRVLYNSINILGIPSELEFAVIGVVILCGVLADELVKRFAASRPSAELTAP